MPSFLCVQINPKTGGTKKRPIEQRAPRIHDEFKAHLSPFAAQSDPDGRAVAFKHPGIRNVSSILTKNSENLTPLVEIAMNKMEYISAPG